MEAVERNGIGYLVLRLGLSISPLFQRVAILSAFFVSGRNAIGPNTISGMINQADTNPFFSLHRDNASLAQSDRA